MSGRTAGHLIRCGLCPHLNEVPGPRPARCPSLIRDEGSQMESYGMESKAGSFSPTLTPPETDVGLGLRPGSCSSHHGGRESWGRREPSWPPAETAPSDDDKQRTSLPKTSCGPGTGRSSQCLTPQKYIISNNILWFTEHFLIIVLLGFTCYFCLEYCLSRFDDSNASHLLQFVSHRPVHIRNHLDIFYCLHVLLQPGPT